MTRTRSCFPRSCSNRPRSRASWDAGSSGSRLFPPSRTLPPPPCLPCSSYGRGWGTTGAPSTSSAAPRKSSPCTMAWSRVIRRRCWPCPALDPRHLRACAYLHSGNRTCTSRPTCAPSSSTSCSPDANRSRTRSSSPSSRQHARRMHACAHGTTPCSTMART